METENELKMMCLKQCGFRIVNNGQLQDAPVEPVNLKKDTKRGLHRRLNNVNSDPSIGQLTTYMCSVNAETSVNGIKTYDFEVVVTEPIHSMYNSFSEKLRLLFHVRVMGPDNHILAAGTDPTISAALTDFN